AEWFERRVNEDDRFVLVTPRSAALVCFRLKSGDEATRVLLDRVNEAGEILLSHAAAPGDGAHTIRFVPGSPMTEFRHVARAWAIIAEAAGG
ncbi:MAG: hypothetical protein K8E66_01545, partial [Phycisphaerales bacterium]|nr:hypothetical protein [Phycisphaerales bacterium]